MNVSEIMAKMIAYSKGNLHDINHFLKVYAYAGTIAELEGISGKEKKTAEIAAIVHDIACPLCREKYGNTNGKYQEKEGVILTREFLTDTGLPEDMSERVVYLVGHHHTPQEADGIDYQILLEADYLVNADEMHFSDENIRNAEEKLFKTSSGKELLKAIYGKN